MSEFEKELEMISQEMGEEEEVKLPTLEEQKAVVEELKRLEAAGELTEEVLAKHFSQFSEKPSKPIH